MDTYPITTDEMLRDLTASADQTQYSSLLEQCDSEEDKQQLTSINFICMDRMKMLAVLHDFKKVEDKLQSVTTKPPGSTKSAALASASVQSFTPVRANVTTSSVDLEKGTTGTIAGRGVGGDGFYERKPQQTNSKFVWTKRRILMLSVVIFVVLVFVIFGIAYKVKVDDDNQHKKNAHIATISVSSMVSSTSMHSTSSSSATSTSSSSMSITSTTSSLSSKFTTSHSSATSSESISSSSGESTTTNTESTSSNTSTSISRSTLTETPTRKITVSNTEEETVVTYSNPNGSWKTTTDVSGSTYETWVAIGGTWTTKTTIGKNAYETQKPMFMLLIR
ncbi:unnamed protein product [Ambrosiozyma monospora]|uniref:Unnamed protein product n=1 Tax=Ambrosiozyma monospora TaxID=43982 RepID=A0A9W6WBB0_AMBMO|nr:unnamed protein product [Ambrosiozyma monospora]